MTPRQVRLRQKLSDTTGAVKSFFTGKAAEKDPAVAKLEELKVGGRNFSYLHIRSGDMGR